MSHGMLGDAKIAVRGQRNSSKNVPSPSAAITSLIGSGRLRSRKITSNSSERSTSSSRSTMRRSGAA